MEQREQPLRLVDLLNGLLRQWRMAMGVFWTFVALGLAVIVLGERNFTSAASFVPITSSAPNSNLMGIAAQLGFQMPTSGENRPPDFYEELFESREVLARVAGKPYTWREARDGDAGDVQTGTLAEFWELDDERAEVNEERAIRRLARIIRVDVSRLSGIVTLSVRTTSADVSYQVATNMLQEVNDFELMRRREVAASEHEFLSARIDEAQVELDRAEDQLGQFLVANRGFSDSPTLAFQHDRLRRRVELRMEVLKSLLESEERIAMEQARNTPVITVLDQPKRPALPDSRNGLLKLIAVMLFAAALGATAAIVRDGWTRLQMADRDAYLEFHTLRRDITGTLRKALPRRRSAGDAGSD